MWTRPGMARSHFGWSGLSPMQSATPDTEIVLLRPMTDQVTSMLPLSYSRATGDLALYELPVEPGVKTISSN
jgi:hypothetical protein